MTATLPTGPDLIDPCPFHRWDQLVLDLTSMSARCACEVRERSA